MKDIANLPMPPTARRLPRILTAILALPALCLGLLPAVHAASFTLASTDQTIIGDDQVVTTVYEDTLYDLAHKYGVDSQELIRVNPGIDPWLPGVGKKVIVPGRFILPPGIREGIVVNVPEHRLYYFPKARRGKPQIVITYPVSVGKLDWNTPIGLTYVTQKLKNPTWHPPAGVRKEHLEEGDPLPAAVPPGPDNPLGQYALRLAAGGGTYLIHGTNNPVAVGLPVTHGCIRLYPDDVETLFPLVPVGTHVHIINEPIKVTWVDGQLLLEAHPPINDDGDSVEPDVDAFATLLQNTVGNSTVAINWEYAREELAKADGQLATVGLQADLSPLTTTTADSTIPAGSAPASAIPADTAPASTGPAAAEPAALPSQGAPSSAPAVAPAPVATPAATAAPAAAAPAVTTAPAAPSDATPAGDAVSATKTIAATDSRAAQ